MKERELIDMLKRKSIFSVQDVQRVGNFNANYAKLALNRLNKRGVIKRISRNKYCIEDDIYVISSNLKFPSYVSFWSASAYYGFTEQILNSIFLATTKNYKKLEFEGYKIKFIKTKDFFGFKKIKTDKGEIFMVEQEKLLLDCFVGFKQMGNFDEIVKVFEQADVSKDKIIDYLKRTNNRSLFKKVGFMLEKYKNIDISDEFDLDRNYVFLNPFTRKFKEINSKWMVKL